MSERIVVFRMPFQGPTYEFGGLHAHALYQVSTQTPDSFKGDAKVIVLPGSGQTLRDLDYLRQSGGADAIQRHLSGGGAVLGVCGGYQILGEQLLDPMLKQGEHEKREGLGYLPISTLFGPVMISTSTQAQLLVGTGSGGAIKGEERRSGYSTIGKRTEAMGFLKLDQIQARQPHQPLPQAGALTDHKLIWAPGQERFDGLVSGDGKVWGTYLHLIANNDAFLRTFFSSIV